jgi:hypothetical protein
MSAPFHSIHSTRGIERMLTLAIVVDGEVDFWFNVFGFFSHCDLSVS